MSKPDSWMPIYWADYWKDTAHLSAAESGAYLNLLGEYWTRGVPLPDDDSRLYRLARMDRDEWDACKETIKEFFTITPDGLVQKRLQEQLDAAKEAYEVRVERSRKANAKKSSKETYKDTYKESSKDTPKVSSKGPNLELRTSTKVEDTPKAPKGAYSAEFEDWWKAYPHKVAKDSAWKAYSKARKAGASAEELKAGIAPYVAHKPPDRAYCNPSTWLNGGRWKDEYGQPDKPESLDATAYAALRNWYAVHDERGNYLRPREPQTRRWMETLGPKPGEPGFRWNKIEGEVLASLPGKTELRVVNA